MAGYQERNEDAYISILPSPPYSEDGNDHDDRTRFRSDEHFDNILSHSDLNKKSVPHKKHTTISKSKIHHPNKILQKNFMHSIKNYNVKEKENKTELGSSSKHKLAKIYPNLLNLSNPYTVNAESQIAGSQTKSSYINKKVRCYVCNQNVENVHLKDHLLFGTLQCSDCGWKEDDCYSFRKYFRNKRKITVGCNHEEQRWLSDPLDFLTKGFVTKDRFSLQNKKLLDEHLEHYMSYIVDLWDIKPWDSAIDLCRIYLSSAISKNSQYMPSFTPEPKKAKKGTHLLDLPVDGRYYISKEVIEECRDCYSKLNIHDFQFYVSTALITTSCRNCDLPIYFVLTPPNGAKPFLEITLS